MQADVPSGKPGVGQAVHHLEGGTHAWAGSRK